MSLKISSAKASSPLSRKGHGIPGGFYQPRRIVVFLIRLSLTLVGDGDGGSGRVVRCRGSAAAAERSRRSIGSLRERGRFRGVPPGTSPGRSEEHTSELQSQFHLVCR